MFRGSADIEPVLAVSNLRKVYQPARTLSCCPGTSLSPGKVAVRNLSLAVSGGSVFGLLGHNGAGKAGTPLENIFNRTFYLKKPFKKPKNP